jgi:hypothetical protein
MVNTRNNHCNS